jgi:hypothetical protein
MVVVCIWQNDDLLQGTWQRNSILQTASCTKGIRRVLDLIQPKRTPTVSGGNLILGRACPLVPLGKGEGRTEKISLGFDLLWTKLD